MSESRLLLPVVEKVWPRIFPEAYGILKSIKDWQNRYQKGDIFLGEASRSIACIAHQIYRLTDVIVEVSARQARMNQYGCFELAPGEKKFRGNQNFDGLQPLSTGISQFGLACAIYHPDIGIAVAHNDTYSVNDIDNYIKEPLLNGQDIVSLLYGSDRVLPEDMIKKATIEQILKETLGQVLQLFGHNLPEGTKFNMLGLSYINSREIADYIGVMSHYLGVHFSFGYSSRVREKFEHGMFDIDVIVGQDAFLIYGGEDHPVYPKPKLFSR